MDLDYSTGKLVEIGGASDSGLLLKDVYALYRRQFWRWFGITAPTSILAAVTLLMADQRVRAIYSGIPPRELQFHWGEIVEAGLVRFGGFFVSWFLACFALAAIATVANGLDEEEGHGIWKSDSFQRAREHFGAVLLVGMFTFFAFIAGMAVVLLADLALFRVLGKAHFSRYNYGTTFVGSLAVLSIVSWFGMAIPLILSSDLGVWAALKRSLKISNGYEGFLVLLVVESTVGSYVAWYAIHYGLMFLFPPQLRSAEWYGWLVYAVAIIASAAVQPPMFIGFSLLAATRQSDSGFLPRSHKPAHID